MNLKFKKVRYVFEHLNEFQSLVNHLATVKIALDAEIHALLVLSTLHDNWETFVMSVNNHAPNGVLSLSVVKDKMFNEETRMGLGNAQEQGSCQRVVVKVEGLMSVVNLMMVTEISLNQGRLENASTVERMVI